MDERWQEIERIFHAARGLDGSVRRAFLGEACAQDRASGEEVELQLAREGQAGSFLETPIEMVATAFGKGERIRDTPKAVI